VSRARHARAGGRARTRDTAAGALAGRLPAGLAGAATTAGLRAFLLPVSLVASLGTARLVIHHGGAAVFAAVSLVATLSALLPFADLGLGAAVTNVVAASPDPGADPGVLAVTAKAVRLLVAVAAGLLVADAAVTLGPGWAGLLGAGGAGLAQLNAVTAAVVALVALGLPLALGQRLLLATGRAHLMVLGQSCVAPLGLVASLLVAHTGVAVGWYAVATPAAAAAVGAASLAMALHLTGLRASALARAVAARLPAPALAPVALPMMVIMVGLPLALQSDRLLLSHRASIAALASYALVAQLYGVAWSVFSVGGATLWPAFARARADGRPGAGYRRALAGFAAAALVAAVAFPPLAAAVAHLVGGTTVVASRGLLVCFAVLLAVQVVHLPSGMLLTDAAGLGFQAVCVAAMVTVNLALGWRLAPTWGASGPVVASAVSVAACQLVPALARGWRLSAPARAPRAAAMAAQGVR